MQEGRVCCVGCRGVTYRHLLMDHAGCLVANRGNLVANKPAVVANKLCELVANGTRHGVYRDVEARREYMRQYMARRRAEARKGV